MDRKFFAKQPIPLVQAAAGGGARILRIERQQHDFIAIRGAQLLDRLGGERMPVAHGHKAAGVNAQIVRAAVCKRAACCSVKRRMGEAAADGGIVMLHFAGACGGNQFGRAVSVRCGQKESQ